MAQGTPLQTTAEPAAPDGTFGLIARLIDEVSTLLRKELALVTAEISTTIRDAKRGVAAVAAGAAVLFAGFLLLLAALTAGLAQAMPVWLSSLLVGGVTVMVGYFLLAAGKKKVKPTR
jgi:hypothetical protein